MRPALDRPAAEARFPSLSAYLCAVTAHARRRGRRHAEAIAAEVMAVAWRRRADVPTDDPRPWLYATARNLLLADARRSGSSAGTTAEAIQPAPELHEIDPALWSAL